MAKGRTISASFLTDKDKQVIELCRSVSKAIYGHITNDDYKEEFEKEYGKVDLTRDSSTGRAGGKLQRDAVCTRGRTGKAPFSNRNLRWHPLVVAEKKPAFAETIERIEIEGDVDSDSQVLVFVIKDSAGREIKYPSDKVHEMTERFAALPKHWIPHINRLKHWSDTLWTQNSCVISALEACDWFDSVETYAVLGLSLAVDLYGANFETLYNEVQKILQSQTIDDKIAIPSSLFPTNKDNITQCPVCRLNISKDLERFRSHIRGATWQPAWRPSKQTEGNDSSIQVMHVDPLLENEIRHNASNVKYGHRWCNVAMTDHSLDETLDFMEFVVKAHNGCIDLL